MTVRTTIHGYPAPPYTGILEVDARLHAAGIPLVMVWFDPPIEPKDDE